jgi:hypothetical protein
LRAVADLDRAHTTRIRRRRRVAVSHVGKDADLHGRTQGLTRRDIRGRFDADERRPARSNVEPKDGVAVVDHDVAPLLVAEVDGMDGVFAGRQTREHQDERSEGEEAFSRGHGSP